MFIFFFLLLYIGVINCGIIFDKGVNYLFLIKLYINLYDLLVFIIYYYLFFIYGKKFRLKVLWNILFFFCL